MERKRAAYRCIKKRKRHNLDAVKKALQARMNKSLNTGTEVKENIEPNVTNMETNESQAVLDIQQSVKGVDNHKPDIQPNDDSEGVLEDISVMEYELCNSKTIEDIIIAGKRIVDFQYFWNQLMVIDSHGERFGCKISYLKIIKEHQKGLISKLDLECSMCRSKFTISTSKEEEIIDLNSGAVSGAIMAGIGLSNLNELVASMDLPTLNFRLYDKKHGMISEMWKATAEQTMQNAAKAEIEAAKACGDVNSQGIAMISVEADACWSKRSYKNNYSALSGVAAIIGERSGKVLHIGVLNKFCLTCARANKKGVEPKNHNCSKNFSGSSTSMEQAILVDGFKKSIKEKNLIYRTLIADGDSSTYKRILESRPYADIPVQKIECTNHLLRNYNGKNLLLQKDTSIPLSERKLLSSDRLTRLRTAIRAAVKYRKDENESESTKIIALQKDIINSPRHVFGDHSKCEDYYCTAERKKETNQIPNIPTLFLKLSRNVSQLAYNSRSLLYCYTNNRAEQFNSVVAKMVGGKRVNYSLKGSYTARCYAAVVAYNTGNAQYTLYKNILQKSPGKSLKILEARRKIKNCREVKARSSFARKKLRLTVRDAHYGFNCERPDMTSREYEDAKLLFLENLRTQLSNRHEIQRATILQAESSLWIELRRCILTASTFAKICKRRPNQNSAPLVKSILYAYKLDNVASIKHGKDNELKALTQLSKQEHISIERCGLFIDEEFYFLGATPDGLFTDGLIEIKCPSSAYGMDVETAIKDKKLKCFKIEKGQVVFNTNHDWYYQVQGQLHIANKEICLFAVWTGSEFPVKVIKIFKDDKFWKEKMFTKLDKFYNTSFLPEVIDPRKARSMPLREIFL